MTIIWYPAKNLVEILTSGNTIKIDQTNPNNVVAILATQNTVKLDQTDPNNVIRKIGADLHITATAAVNTAATATLPAVASKFHYISRVELIKLYSIVGVANGAGVIITTTNLPGNPAFTTEQLASPAGTAIKVIEAIFSEPLKSSVVNTATTFVAPAQLQTIWRWNITYRSGA